MASLKSKHTRATKEELKSTQKPGAKPKASSSKKVEPTGESGVESESETGSESQSESGSESGSGSEVENKVEPQHEPISLPNAMHSTGVHLLGAISTLDLRQQIIANAVGLYEFHARVDAMEKRAAADNGVKASRVGRVMTPTLDESSSDGKMGLDILVTYQRQNYVALLMQRGSNGTTLARSRARDTAEGALHSLLYLTAQRLQEDFGDVLGDDNSGGWATYNDEDEEEEGEGKQEEEEEKEDESGVKAAYTDDW